MVHVDETGRTSKQAWPNLPAAWQHRMSVRWLTLESLRILQDRVSAQAPVRVLLWTSAGCIEGELVDIADSYDAARRGSSVSDVDVASAVAHLRTELWAMYATRDADLEPADSAALIHVRNAIVRIGARRLHVPHMAVFAGDVVGFTLTNSPVL